MGEKHAAPGKGVLCAGNYLFINLGAIQTMH